MRRQSDERAAGAPDSQAARLPAGRPAPEMRWPQWAARPWLGEAAAANSQMPADCEKVDKWRRVDDRARRPQFAYVVKADDGLRALAESRARAIVGPEEGESFEEPSELLELESLLGQSSEAVETGDAQALPSSFAAFAKTGIAPTFLSISRSNRDVDDEDLGPDADILEPISGLESVVHGSCRRFYFAPKRREYIGLVPRALALAKNELRVLYNCRIVLPACWFTAENFDNRRICTGSVTPSHEAQDPNDEPTSAARLVKAVSTSSASRDPDDERAYAALALRPILEHDAMLQHDVRLIPRSSTSPNSAPATARSEHHSLYY